jgi:integrase
MARFSLLVGLRESNITRFEWSQVNLDQRVAWICPDQSKSEATIGIPLNIEAMVVLRRQVGKHSERVFTYH